MIEVAIVEDEKYIRDMLTELIGSSRDHKCTAVFENAEDAMSQLSTVHPHVALVDVHLPGTTGIDCVSKLKALMPDVQFVMCTSLEDSETIFKALQAGATGYMTKATPPAKILEAITDAHNGGSPMSSQIARKVISFFQQKPQSNSELDKLSVREQEILQYLSKGYRYKEMASMLNISIETVRKHIHNIYEKLQVNSRTDAINKVYARA
jgi:DNA-binding NarL/FixJ family response regulator